MKKSNDVTIKLTDYELAAMGAALIRAKRDYNEYFEEAWNGNSRLDIEYWERASKEVQALYEKLVNI